MTQEATDAFIGAGPMVPVALMLFAVVWLATAGAPHSSVVAANFNAAPLEEDRFEKESIVSGLDDPVEMAVLDDGRVLIAERLGAVKLYQPTSQQTIKLGIIPSHIHIELGLCGMAPAPDFAKSGDLYITYCSPDEISALRVSRFRVDGERLDLGSERILIRIPVDHDVANHMGGGMAFDSRGNLYIGLGDNSPPIPEVPIDTRPGKHLHDSQRSAANSRDFRGKVLRIHPEPDGGYSIPPDNLFADGRHGLPEVFVMGCRNPFRVQIDRRTDWLYWGDVGPNVSPEAKMGPTGYDEINQARAAGNFGWPMFVGPNEAYAELNFDTREVGPKFDPAHPVNRSPNNTGIRELPPAMPALIWYPSEESREFPELGVGGRSAMVGPVYYRGDARLSDVELPEQLDRTLFICEWMRNWIKAVRLDADGKVVAVQPFCNHLEFHRPIDLRLGPEGALYVLEYGDRWDGNHDAQVTRIVYRGGNRRPIARLKASSTAGKGPLTVSFDGSASFDKDPNDRLVVTWRAHARRGGDVPLTPNGDKQATATFRDAGVYEVEMTVTDPSGAAATASELIYVGNERPIVRFDDIAENGFFDWDEPIDYLVHVDDPEDGATSGLVVAGNAIDGAPAIAPEFVSTQIEYRLRRLGLADADLDPAESLIRKSTCLGCHAVAGQSKGPAYRDVAKKYSGRSDAVELLAKKILGGGAGVWGAYPMPPHPQHTLDQARVMAAWILTQSEPIGPISQIGLEGGFVAKLPRFNVPDGGLFFVTASYTDRGFEDLPPLRGEATAIFHARRKRAAFHDVARGPLVVHDLEGERTQFVAMGDGDSFGFAELNLRGIDRVRYRVGHRGRRGGTLELRLDQVDGPLVGVIQLKQAGWQEGELKLPAAEGIHHLFVVGHTRDANQSLQVNWLEFLDSPAAAAARQARRERAEKRIAAVAQRSKPREFVQDWTIEELLPSAEKANRGRSFERGKSLFSAATCGSCHRIGDSGGNVGPNLTEVAARMAKQSSPRAALLTEIIDPSRVIDDKFRTRVVVMADGQQLAGVMIEDANDFIRLAANPARPDEVRLIHREQIEEISVSPVSLMPVGLLNTFSADEIWDLVAYLEAGGRADHPAFRP